MPGAEAAPGPALLSAGAVGWARAARRRPPSSWGAWAAPTQYVGSKQISMNKISLQRLVSCTTVIFILQNMQEASLLV